MSGVLLMIKAFYHNVHILHRQYKQAFETMER